MIRIKLLLSIALICAASVVFSQTEIIVSPMKVGTKLTAGDIGFLALVSKSKLDSSKKAAGPSATLDGINYRTGHVLTAAEVRSLTKAISTFQAYYRGRDGQRIDGMCIYYYLYCSESLAGWCAYYSGWFWCGIR